jgi:hemoglobin/transferrin/lactoferrin receptor protein
MTRTVQASRHIRRSLIAGLLAATFGSLQAAEAVAIDIGAQPLGAALAKFSAQSGIKAVYPAELLVGKTAPAISGKLSPQQALDKLLAGSGLAYRFVTADAVRIEAVAQPDATTRPHQLAEVVVSATRTANPIDQVAASVSVISRDDIEETQAGSVSQVLKKLPNVEFGGGPRVNGEIPTIRGYSGKSITLLVDGARQNNATNTLRSPLYIDPYFIEKAEILRGSTSSLYGPGGAGGAMAFTTISARDFLSGDQHFGGGVKTGYAAGDKSSHVNARIYGQNEMLDGLLAVGYHDWNDIRQGGGSHLSPNDGNSSTALVKLGLNTPQLRYELSHQQYNSDNLENNNPQADSSLTGAPAVQQFHTAQQQTVLKASTLAGADWPALSASIYSNDLKITADRGASAATAPYTLMRTETTGASLQASVNPSSGEAIGHRLTSGIDYYEDKQSAISGSAPNSVIPNGKQQVAGLFIQDEIALGASWRLTPSLRADRFETSAEQTGASTSASHVSPKVVLAWQATNALSIYGSYGEAFRTPSINELYWSISGTSYFNNFRPNPDLKPEIDETFEIGANFNRKGIFSANDRVKLRINAFDSTASDLINSTVVGTYVKTAPFAGTGSIFQYQNVSKAKRRGGELEASYSIGNWQYSLAYSRVRVTDSSNGNGLFSPPDKLSLEIRRQIPSLGLNLYWKTTQVEAQDYDATLLRRRPGYTTSDLFLSWTPNGQRFRIDAGVSNLFDERYSTYQSSAAYANTYQEGRSLRAAVSLDF